MDYEISVIIPTLNSPVIDKTIDSVLNQDYDKDKFEVIVVGQDKERLLEGMTGIRLFQSEKVLNPAEARNIGIDQAKGKVILFIDADCIASKEWMKNLIKHHYRGERVIGGGLDSNTDNFYLLCDNVSHFYNTFANSKRGYRDEVMPTVNLSIDKELLLEIGKFNETLVATEDNELYLKLRRKGIKIFFEPEAVVYHESSRRSLRGVLKHSMFWGKHSIKFRNKYRDILGTPKLMMNPYLIFLLSPVIALYVTANIFLKNLRMLKFIYTVPVIYLSKIAWCIGASKELLTGEGRE